jgi:sugar (pentulose or hexulose) kinase
MSKDYLLAIDCGTQSVRALIFDLHGHLVDKAQVEIDSYQSPQPGWVENDPEQFWATLCQACQRLWANTRVPKSALAGVCITTQRATVINLDEHGQPVRPAIVWLDQRRADVDPKLAWWWEVALRAVRMRDTVRYFAREAEANWIAQHQPALWARTDKYLLLSGYLNWRFTGRFVDSVASQVGYIPSTTGAGAGPTPGTGSGRCLPLRRDMLPELVPAGARLGTRERRGRARHRASPKACRLIAGAADKACEVIGAGCLTPESRLPLLRHRRDHQCQHAALPRSHALHPALPGRDPRNATTPKSRSPAASGW